MSENNLYVVGIDFGTSNTAVAYAKIPHKETSNVDIVIYELDKNQPKTKTIVALDTLKPHGKQCIAFGNQVKILLDDDEEVHANVLIFEHFKMALHDADNENDDVMAHNGRKLKVKHVIGETLRYLVEKTVSEINSQNRLGWNRERPLSGEQFGNMKFG